jgi:hypothetical protein
MTTATAAAAMTDSARTTGGGYPLRYREKRGTADALHQANPGLARLLKWQEHVQPLPCGGGR